MTGTRRTRENTGVGPSPRGHRRPEPTMWVGWITFAGVIMLLLGAFQAMEGLVALVNDDYYHAASSGLVLSVDYTAWGWVHLLLGILVAAAGVGVMIGQLWARAVGVLVAALCAIVNIGFLAAYPVGVTVIIAIDVLVIYVLVVHGKESQPDDY